MKTIRTGVTVLGLLLAGASLPATAAGACDRACLTGIAEQYLAALVTHDPSRAPLARNARYTENGVELPLPYGMGPGWSAPKQTFESPQAIKDGFKEYP